MVVLFKIDEVRTITPAGKKFTLQELQELVGGNIQIVKGHNYTYVMDEEGYLKNAFVNTMPTLMAHRDRAIDQSDYFNGTVIVGTHKELK